MANTINIEGVISKQGNFSYGFWNGKYSVLQGLLYEYDVTKMKLSFEEAKNLFDVLVFSDKDEANNKKINIAIKQSRKTKLKGNRLFWFLFDNI